MVSRTEAHMMLKPRLPGLRLATRLGLVFVLHIHDANECELFYHKNQNELFFNHFFLLPFEYTHNAFAQYVKQMFPF